jgi:uncharacterized protein YjiS (DUF1127 family)
MTIKTAENALPISSGNAGIVLAALRRVIAGAWAVHRRTVTIASLRSLSPAQLQDIGLDPDHFDAGVHPAADPATMANLMSLR